MIDWNKCDAAIWRSLRKTLKPVNRIDNITLGELVGIEKQKTLLLDNTKKFLNNKPANNALLWGARGTGKSSLIKAVFNHFRKDGLKLIEINRNDLIYLTEIVDNIENIDRKFILFCDDFSFEEGDNTYIYLKSVLEGSIEAKPDNILLYVTSNRRHLIPEYLKENLNTNVSDDEIHYSDAVEEKIALSDRFGLWISFYQGSLKDYLKIVDSYFKDFEGDRKKLHEAAKIFAASRASRSGRTAKQFYKFYLNDNF
jgi:predicted AAA+ superfamily ATPase